MTDESGPQQIRTHTHEHGRVYAQVEHFPAPDPDVPVGRKVPHLVLQPTGGGAAHRLRLDTPETDQFLEDYPELKQLVDEYRGEQTPDETASRPRRRTGEA